MGLTIRNKTDQDQDWLLETLTKEWGGPMIERTGEFIDALALDTMIVEEEGKYLGLATLLHTEEETEIVTFNAFEPRRSIGTIMLADIVDAVKRKGAKRIKVFTSNDNLDALRFYQRRGFRIEKVWKDSITEARKIKPSIPLEGQYGIPCCDEIELHRAL